MQRDPRSGHTNRVTHCDRAAAAVDLRRIDSQFTGRGERDGREGLIDLDHLELVSRDALPGDGLLDGVRRLRLQRGVRTGHHTVRADLTQPAQPEFLGFGLVHHHDGATTIGDLRC